MRHASSATVLHREAIGQFGAPYIDSYNQEFELVVVAIELGFSSVPSIEILASVQNHGTAANCMRRPV